MVLLEKFEVNGGEEIYSILGDTFPSLHDGCGTESIILHYHSYT